MESNPNHDPCSPVHPVAPYIGGKAQLARRLVERIEAVPHDCYVEPFVGMGGVFFRRYRRPKVEVINDISRDVATLFRILQRHYPQLLDTLRFQITSRAEFQRLAKTDPDTLTDLERASRFLYLQRISSGQPARFNLTRLVPLLEDVHERLAGVTIECLPWATVIARYDRPGTLFYVDPPYHGVEDYYGKGLFARSDFALLADALGAVRGRWIMSINDTPEIRRLFGAWRIEEASLTYTASSGQPKRVTELIIMGGGAVFDGGSNGR